MCEYIEKIPTIANEHLVEEVVFAWLESYICQMVKWYLLIQRSALYYIYLGHSVVMSAGFSLMMLAKFRGVIT